MSRRPGIPVDPYHPEECGQTTRIPSLDDYDEWDIFG